MEALRGLLIYRLEVKYRFFVHPNINKTNRIKENKIFPKKTFCHGVDLLRNRPKSEDLQSQTAEARILVVDCHLIKKFLIDGALVHCYMLY